MIPLLRGQRQAHSPSAGTAESQMPSPLSWGIGRAATLLKTLLQYFGKSLEALIGVAYPGFRDNRSTLNTKTGYLKKIHLAGQLPRSPSFPAKHLSSSMSNHELSFSRLFYWWPALTLLVINHRPHWIEAVLVQPFSICIATAQYLMAQGNIKL